MGSASTDGRQAANASSNDPTGAAGNVVAGAGSIDFNNLSSDDAASLLAASPFGPLITQAGLDAGTLLASLSGGGANNFLALQGLGGANNPFGDTPSGGAGGGIPATDNSGSQYASATDITSDVYAQITADGGSATDMMVPTT